MVPAVILLPLVFLVFAGLDGIVTGPYRVRWRAVAAPAPHGVTVSPAAPAPRAVAPTPSHGRASADGAHPGGPGQRPASPVTLAGRP